MRLYIVRTLLRKEILRHLAERGAIFLSALLIAVALLLTFFGKDNAEFGGRFVAGIQRCYILTWDDQQPWVKYLMAHKPKELPVEVRSPAFHNWGTDGNPQLEQSTVAVTFEPRKDKDGQKYYRLRFYYQNNDPGTVAPFADWFWRQSLEYYRDVPLEVETTQDQIVSPEGPARIEVMSRGTDKDGTRRQVLWITQNESAATATPVRIHDDRIAFKGTAEVRSLMAAFLAFFALVFMAVYLLPSLTCEERERGVLLAQALSPANPVEIVAAKFLFYPTVGVALAALVCGIYRPAALTHPSFWVVLVINAMGFLGIGLCIATVSKTQRAASMTALCYMMTVALLMSLTQLAGISFLQYAFLEFYGPRLLHEALLDNPAALVRWDYIVISGAIATGWVWAAIRLFHQRGWQ